MDELIKYANNICNALNSDDFSSYSSNYIELLKIKKDFCDEEKKFILDWCVQMLLENNNTLVIIFLYSIMIAAAHNRSAIHKCINFLRHADVDYKIKYKVLRQINAWIFWYPNDLSSIDVFVDTTRFLEEIVSEVKATLPENILLKIPENELNNNLILFITTQFVGPNHGPTRHALDHCVSVIKKMNKNVLLINTAETGGGVKCTFPLYNIFMPFYSSELNNIDSYPWQGYNIPFVQCDDLMPNTDELILLINTIRRIKPYRVIEIGSGSLLTGLIDDMVPTLVNGTLHSSIETSAAKYQTIARHITEEEKNALHLLGRTENHMIYSMFSTVINKKDEVINRELLGVPDSAFVIAVIGTRLHLEITEELMDILNNCLNRHNNLYIIFFGKFSNYETLVSKYGTNKNRFIYYGYTTYSLGCLEQCDLYLNPYRIGGGMSAIEAMVAGIPAISTNYGDAGVVLGNDFWVDSILDYENKISQYIDDSNFYTGQSKKAYERGIYLQDSDRLWIDTIKEFERRL